MAKSANAFVAAAENDVTKSKKDGLTANGAVTRKTSGQVHLDLFAIVGAARNARNDVVSLFSKAYASDKALALRIMLWARDIRGGAGARQAFRDVLRHLSVNDPVVAEMLVPVVSEYGRWDDAIESLPVKSHAFKVAAAALKDAIDSGNGLAAKWTPRKGDIAVALREEWEMSPKQYRKYIVTRTNVVETLMCNKEWDKIAFDKLPSLAGLRYQKAFSKNAAAQYEKFKNALVKGEAKINVSTLFPHNIVANIRHGAGYRCVVDAQWKALPDYLNDLSGKVLCMSDVSGSMESNVGGNVTAMDVSIALGLYTSERLRGPFKDMVLTFSGNPKLHKVTGNTITERIGNLDYHNWDTSTDIQKAFELVLKTGVQNKVPQSDMPETIIIISDMEFNQCVRNGDSITNYGGIKRQYADAGYNLPQIVFWNVNGRAGNNPVKHDAAGTAMVSGYSPSILQSVLTGKDFDPTGVMFETVMKPRYDVADNIVG